MSGRAASILLLLATTALAGCGSGEDREEQSSQTESASCVARLTWEDEDYVGSGVRVPPERGEELGEATIPACGDSEEREVEVARIPGVDPAVAIGNPEDPFTIWLAESARTSEFPQALDRIIYGLSCEENRAFTLAGRWVGLSNPDDPLYVQIDVDQTDAVGDSYRGLVIDLAVLSSTQGLSSHDAFPAGKLGQARLRARVRCIGADKPNQTFAAESIELVGG